MRKNKDFILQNVAEKNLLIPVGDIAVDFNGFIVLNDTAKFMWENSSDVFSRNDLIKLVKDKYSADDKTANEAVDLYIKDLKENRCILDE